MNKHGKISNTEMEIMRAIWEADEPLTIAQLQVIFKDRNWKMQTMAAFLERMIAKGVLGSDKKFKNNLYFAIVNEKEFHQLVAKEMLDKTYGGSVKNFLAALYGDGAIDAKEAEELRQWLKKAGG